MTTLRNILLTLLWPWIRPWLGECCWSHVGRVSPCSDCPHLTGENITAWNRRLRGDR